MLRHLRRYLVPLTACALLASGAVLAQSTGNLFNHQVNFDSSGNLIVTGAALGGGAQTTANLANHLVNFDSSSNLIVALTGGTVTPNIVNVQSYGTSSAPSLTLADATTGFYGSSGILRISCGTTANCAVFTNAQASVNGAFDAARYNIAGTLANSSTAPTISAGFCTSPAVAAANGNFAFALTIGTSCGAATGTLTLPAATTGWVCDLRNVTSPASNVPSQTGGTTTTATFTNYARTTGLAANWTDSEALRGACRAY